MNLMRFNDLSSVRNQTIKCSQNPTVGLIHCLHSGVHYINSNCCFTDQLYSAALVIGTELH